MTKPVLIDKPNVSLAWAEAFVALQSAPHRISPLTISFAGLESGEVVEDQAIRTGVDVLLATSEKQKVQTVANTIFPQALWRVAKGDRPTFYANYRENLPEYVAMESSKNRRGLYFGRMIGWQIDPKTGEPLQPPTSDGVPEDGNQLEYVIRRYKKGLRASAYQISIFDPARDHIDSPYLGFPCLQHLTFVPDSREGTIALNAFYATQQLFEKGYGNFLGLARLGLYIASQTDLCLTRVTCFVGIEKIDSEGKPKAGKELDALVSTCKAQLDNSEQTAGVLT